MRKIVAIVGDSNIEKGGAKYNFAFAVGKALVDNGNRADLAELWRRLLQARSRRRSIRTEIR